MLILHGNNLVASRQALTASKEAARSQGTEIIELNGKKLELGDLKQSLESASLFGSDRLVVIENLFSQPKSKRKDSLLAYLKTGEFQTEVQIWEPKLVDGRVLRSFTKRFQVQTFKLPAVIFKFLDSLQPGEPKELIDLLHQVLKTEPPELVFYLLARRSRELIIAKDLGKKGLTGAPWQVGKLVYQAKKFTLPQLLRLHRNLLKIDSGIKTGQAIFPLKSALDLLMINL